MGGVKKGRKMKNSKTGLAGEINKLLDEINAEHDAVELSPWNLTLDEVLNWCNEESDWDKGKRDYTAMDVWNASTYKEFNEASLGQVYKQWLKSETSSFCIITAYVSTKAPTIKESEKIRHDNKEKFKQLKSDLVGYGYFNVIGHSEQTVDGKKEVLEEPSLFVDGISLDDSMKLARVYKQWGIIYCGPETDGHVKIFYTEGSEEDIGGFHPGRVAAAYSKVRGRPFVFESTLSRPEGWIGNYGCHLNGVKEIPGIRKARKHISKEIRNY
jgi:hypothetical protein